MLDLLEKLSSNTKNEIVLISGRKRETLNRWFGNLSLNLVSEHGVWIKRRQEKSKKKATA